MPQYFIGRDPNIRMPEAGQVPVVMVERNIVSQHVKGSKYRDEVHSRLF